MTISEHFVAFQPSFVFIIRNIESLYDVLETETYLKSCTSHTFTFHVVIDSYNLQINYMRASKEFLVLNDMKNSNQGTQNLIT